MLTVHALIATPESDANLRREYMALGRQAYEAQMARQVAFDPRSMVAGWWFEGYDAAAGLAANGVNPASGSSYC